MVNDLDEEHLLRSDAEVIKEVEEKKATSNQATSNQNILFSAGCAAAVALPKAVPRVLVFGACSVGAMAMTKKHTAMASADDGSFSPMWWLIVSTIGITIMVQTMIQWCFHKGQNVVARMAPLPQPAAPYVLEQDDDVPMTPREEAERTRRRRDDRDQAARLAEARETAKVYKQQRQELLDDRTRAAQDQMDMSATLQATVDEVNDLKRQRGEWTRHNGVLQSTLKVSADEIKALEKERDDLRRQLLQQQQKNLFDATSTPSPSSEQLESLHCKNYELTALNEGLRTTNKTYKDRLHKSHQENHRLKDELSVRPPWPEKLAVTAEGQKVHKAECPRISGSKGVKFFGRCKTCLQ